jgi:hypothetical protein
MSNPGPPTKSGDDGTTFDSAGTFDQPAASTCNGIWVDAWFLTGHGNGGVFSQVPAISGSTNQAPSQTQAAVRYYYGTPATCTACMGK